VSWSGLVAGSFELFVFVWWPGWKMANGEEKSNDFYQVLGLEKKCSASELRNAYKKLALVRIGKLNFLTTVSKPFYFLIFSLMGLL
jgi:hypothetical protein